ncbi:MAG: threonine synthase [Hyphomicrobiales bacterium]|nr:threonine synthase [Hyphomicrobiales bacterium]
MRYISTRGQAPALTFTEALLAGLAEDGGLYVPQTYPQLDRTAIAAFAGKPYAEVAEAVIAPFVGEAIPRAELRAMLAQAYAPFRHAAVAPLAQLGDNLFLMELFHGPTLAFKDVAMQLLGRLTNAALAARGLRATVVGATSGDTGAAAIEAFRGLDRVDVFILYPHGRVSNVQRRQMTTVPDANIHTIALEGSFDDAQSILKGLFRNAGFRKDVGLTGVNSINWARVVAQVVYYFTSAVALGAPHRNVSFTVPTGNFGDILAGYVAKQMGLPIERLVIATNENDILARTLETGRYEVRGVKPTQSPSMDIQVSSNFERLLFDASGRDAARVSAMMAALDQSRGFSIDERALQAIRADFDAFAVSEPQTREEIAETYRQDEYILDPHSAVGVHAARRALERRPATPMIVAGTAHPAKFPDAIKAATGVTPALPPHLAHIAAAPERFEILPNDPVAIEKFIRAKARAAQA